MSRGSDQVPRCGNLDEVVANVTHQNKGCRARSLEVERGENKVFCEGAPR